MPLFLFVAMMKKLLILPLLLVTFFAAAQAPVNIVQPYKFQKWVRVAGSLFSDSAIIASDSSTRVATTGFVKRTTGSAGSLYKLKSDSVANSGYVTHGYSNSNFMKLTGGNNVTGIQRFNYGGTEVYIGPPDGGNNVINTSGTVSFGAANIGYIQGQDFVNSVFTKYNVGPGGIEFIRPLTQTYPTFRLITTNGTDANPQVNLSFGYNLTSNPGYGEDVLQYSARNLYWKGSQVATYSDLTGYFNWTTAAIPQGSVVFTGATGFPTYSTKFYLDSANSRLGIGTNAPTHSITNNTFGASNGGYVDYSTADQTTNYERGRLAWESNSFTIRAEAGGTGTTRSVQLRSGNTQFLVNNGTSSGFGIQITGSAVNSNNVFGIVTTLSGSGTGTASSSTIASTISQGGSMGYNGLFISPFESSVGSGAKYLINAGTNSAANAGGTHTRLFSVTNQGYLTAVLPTYSSGTFTNAIYNSTNNEFESMQGTLKNVSSTKTANYSTLATDEIIPVNSTGGSFNVTLLSTAIIGRVYTIDNTIGTANSITVVGTIDGATNYTLNSGKSITLYKTATGTNTWNIISIK